MNPYVIPTTCDLCGGPGLAHACSDLYGFMRHKDPRVCKEYLEEKEKKQQTKEEKKNEYSL